MTVEGALPVLWAGILAFAVVMYVVMDGFDLGIGIMFRFAPDDGARDTMMNAIAPVWDGNETWLVLGGSVLFAAFPLAYAVLLPAFYLPLVVMLIALVFRGVAFEFRARATGGRRWWDRAFHLGSLVAAFAQGIVLGSFILGVRVENGAFAGTAFDWLTPFALFCGAALVAGYALLGCTWLIMKTAGDAQRWVRRMAPPLLFAVLAAIVIVSVWTPMIRPAISGRWFSWPNIVLLSPVPIMTALIAFGLLRALRRGREIQPFILAVLLFLLSYLGLGISLFPWIAPPGLSIWDAAAAPGTQRFLLWGVGLVLPVVLAYTAYSYRVFRGKASAGNGYH
jgi:cytochrome d ubiquinol oxidase subunit II